MGGDQFALFQSLLDHTSDGIEVVDPETGQFLDVNQSACKAHGYTREEYLRLRVRDLDPTVTDPTWADMLARIRRGEAYVHQGRHIRKDGTEFEVEVSAAFVRDGRDYLLAIVRDISERRRTERELAGSNEQLRQAQKMEAVGRLAGGIAHDFNNLLTVINGNAETILASISPQNPNHELVTDILEAGKRGSSLTRQLLAFSRKQVLLPRVVDLNVLLRETLGLLRRVIGEDIEATLVEEAKLGGTKVDPGQFEQAVVNLVVNARDAMPRGGRLVITTQQTECPQHGTCVCVRVADSGTGMDAATQARIFEPFFTTKEQGRGTGLGLAMVYGFVQQSDGHIEVESTVGKGTTFSIHLPLAEVQPDLAGSRAEKKPEVQGTETILLVEDEDAVRRLAKRSLTARGYTVLDAKDGEHALEVSRTYRGTIDLLVTDLIMPRLGGRELAKTMARERPQLRTLFMSGYIDPEHVVVPDYLQKPFGANELVARIRELLDAPQPLPDRQSWQAALA